MKFRAFPAISTRRSGYTMQVARRKQGACMSGLPLIEPDSDPSAAEDRVVHSRYSVIRVKCSGVDIVQVDRYQVLRGPADFSSTQ